MMPLFLQSLMGYTAESAGLVLSGGGVLLLFLMPVVGFLSSKVQARYMVAFGWLALAVGMYLSFLFMDLDLSFRAVAVLRVAQVVGLPFLFVPINLSSYVGMPAEKSGSVAGLVNFMRNIGSSVGTSLVTTLIERRSQFHQVHLAANVAPGRPGLAGEVAGLTNRLVAAGIDPARALSQAHAIIFRNVVLQATTLAYLDTFLYLGLGSAVMFALAFLLRKNQPGARRVVIE
jgi:DHA2 family multidrug resistance protein